VPRKIDYNEAGSNHMPGAQDPKDPARAFRVVIIMLSEEY
jgi:hypothetical protein